MEYILTLIFGYLIGSIPFAYLVLKKHKNIDIRNLGSGNVGAMNSYEVSNSKKLGVIVLLLDFGKGLIAVVAAGIITNYNNQIILLVLFSAVLGHCFSVWLHFKGGKGLATAAGGSILFFPTIPIIWIFIWVVSYFLKKEINFSNIIATVLTIILILFFGNVLNNFNFAQMERPEFFQIGASIIMSVILIKHYKNISILFKK